MPMEGGALTALRQRADAFLVDTCAIYAPTRTSDGMGGWSTAWAARGTAIDCYLQSDSKAELTPNSNRLTTFTTYTLFVDSAQAIVPSDKVVLHSRTYYVEGVIEEDSVRAYKQAKLTLETTG